MTENRTISRSKFVSPGDYIIRMFLADMLKFMRKRGAWPEIEGEVSSWILAMHGVLRDTPLEAKTVEMGFAALGTLINSAQQEDRIRVIHDQLTKLGQREGPELRNAQESGDQGRFDQLLSDFITEMFKILEIPENLVLPTKSYVSFMELLRATRVFVLCMTLLHKHPLSLIEEASNGNRQATLDLIKIEKMFLNDRCCERTLKKAALQENSEFLGQVQRALQYKPKIGRREMLRLYLFTLFLFEQIKMEMPPINDLWGRLDPMGSEYKSLEAFEKDVQRCRLAFKEMLEQGLSAARVLMQKNSK